MSMVHYHPEGGTVYVRTPEATYDDTLANLNRDFGVEAPPLPDGVVERIYDQGVRHCLVLASNNIDGDVMPWPVGDDLIARIQDGLTAKENRLHINEPIFDMGNPISMVIGS